MTLSDPQPGFQGHCILTSRISQKRCILGIALFVQKLLGGIGVRGPKCLNDGPTRWSKKFSDRFSRFDTIPAVTDSHPATLP